MKIHEYQAKELFRRYNIPTPQGKVARGLDEALKVAEEIGIFPLVLKAQIHAGGRGQGGGIRIVKDIDELKTCVTAMLGSNLITPQTGPEGRPVHAILVEEALKIQREIYLGMVIDRSQECITLMASSEGGMDIERVAAESPEKVISERIDPGVGLRPFQANRVAFSLVNSPMVARQISALILNLYRLFNELDCSLAEINPLAITEQGAFALDAKLNFDDNALFRHPDIAAMWDTAQESPLEVEASRYRLNYIKLHGEVGCLVNGAGLAMAILDLIKMAGANPANFLDVGGGATVEMIKQGMRILCSDPEVKVILIYIFGGILRCDTLAEGLAQAAKEFPITSPLVIRLEGTNVEQGRAILANSGLCYIEAKGMTDAAAKVVELLHNISS